MVITYFADTAEDLRSLIVQNLEQRVKTRQTAYENHFRLKARGHSNVSQKELDQLMREVRVAEQERDYYKRLQIRPTSENPFNKGKVE